MSADHFDEYVPSMVVHTFGDSGAVNGAKEDEMPGKNQRRKVGEKVRSSSLVPNSSVNAGF